MTMVYGLDRSTADVDVLPIGMNASHSLMSLAGQGSCYQRGTADFLNVYQKTALSSGDFRLSGKTKWSIKAHRTNNLRETLIRF